MYNRSNWVDYAKAIGILLVVYGHVVRGLYNAGIEVPKVLYELVDSIIYTFHMPLFFFLSGLFFYSSFLKRGGVKLISIKIDTIVYPYIVWSIIQGVIEAFLSGYTNGNVSYSEVFSLLWSPRAQFWFLYALFITFILASTIFSVVSKKAAIIVFLLSSVIYVYPSILPLDLWFISRNFVFFVFGIVFSLHFKSEHLSNVLLLLFLACAFSIGQFVFHYTFGLNYLDKGIASLLLTLVSILFVVSISSWASLKQNRLLVFIGSSSMAIYLMHVLAGSGVRMILKTVVGTDLLVVHLIAGCLVGVFAPLLVLLIINKLKIPYVFSAPLSGLFYNKALFQRTR